MGLQRLDIYNVRNIRKQSIAPSPNFNFIYGKNASGKSAFIEAIFLLGRAKSFRTSSIKSVICFDQENLVVSSQVLQGNNNCVHFGIEMDGKNIEISINHQKNQKRSDLAYGFPLQIIHPKSFELLDAGSSIRREFLDWGVFNQEQKFLPIWKKYRKILMQRNALLKAKTISQLHVWNKELIFYGKIVNEYRFQYLQNLKPILFEAIEKTLSLHEVDIKLVTGWDINKQFEQLLVDDLEKDLRYGFTHNGPHRGDFQLLLNNKLAKDVVSRGQLKMLVICLKLAQVELTFKQKNSFGCILIDDFAAELDTENKLTILKYLSDINCQVFISATELDDFGDISYLNNYKVFHVEQGRIRGC